LENHHHCEKCGDMIAPDKTFCHNDSAEQLKPIPISDYESYVLWKRNQGKNKVLCPVCLGKGCENCNNTGLIHDSSIDKKLKANNEGEK
jgi:hypothetical protein